MLSGRKGWTGMEQHTTAPQQIERRRKHPRRWMMGAGMQKIVQAAEEMLHLARRILPGFVLCFADMVGIPSGLHVAYMAAQAAAGDSTLWSASGSLLALIMRLVWGLPLRLEMLLAAGIMLLAPGVIFGKDTRWLMGFAALALLPGVMWQVCTGTAADAVCSFGGLGVAALSAPVMLRALRALQGEKPITTMETRVAVGYLAGVMLCGAGRMMLFGLNVGAWGASWAALCMGMFLGAGAGTMIGLLGGVMLALQGLPIGLAVALAMGGFMAGMVQCLGRRWLTCVGFASGCCLAMLLMGAAGNGCMLAAMSSAMVMAGLPRSAYGAQQRLCRRFLASEPTSGDGYASEVLHRWEKTMADMALAVPVPQAEDGPRTASWWKCRLCAGCPDDAACSSMLTELARDHAETVWQARGQEDDAWKLSLENLRGLGCARLYYLRESMDALRREDVLRVQACARLGRQREMLVTHLSAMAQAARRFANLSAGESWWDELSARKLRRALAEKAYAEGLVYARQIQGHASVCYELQREVGAAEMAEELCALTSRTLEVPMMVENVARGRVMLAEMPLWQVECATASCGLDGSAVCGDSVVNVSLPGGRYLAALSDGMGHGEAAQKESQHTVRLLQLCLEAGYTHQQALTAVNGMMILSSRGECFATVDMALADLWTGRLVMDKQGAAASWLIRGREMQEVTGDGLPLGMVEDVDGQEVCLRLRDGDQLLMMTDGVEEAFDDREQLRSALMQAADAQDASAAAWRLIHAAEQGEGQGGHDDRTVAVLRFQRITTVQTRAETL